MLMLLTGQFDRLISGLMPGADKGSYIWLAAYALISTLPIMVGFLLDMAAGDPRWFPHPIRLIGWMIKTAEKLLRPKTSSDSHILIKRGTALAFWIPFLTALATAVILLLAWMLHFIVGFVMESVLCWLILAARSLQTETSPVQHALDHGDLEAARERIGWLVGRNTAELEAEDIVKATVETIAENTNDGVVAPLFYLALGGPILGMAYKAINTLDSMVGYKNERYLHFGRSSAKLDDIAGFVPARLAALLMIIAAALMRMQPGRAWSIFRRDRFNHLSPNSAQTESVCAGALGIQLGGSHYYGERLVEKPYIGDKTREAETRDIARCQQLMLLTSVLSLLFFWPFSALLQLLFAYACVTG